MPKPINQRGFKISKGDFNRYQITYDIDEEGLENVCVYRASFNEKLESSVSITFDEGKIKYLRYKTSQFIDSDDMKGEEWKIKAKQALAIYHEVKRILNVDEELKKYSPRFSHKSEISPFNILGLDDVSQLEFFVEEKKHKKPTINGEKSSE